MRARSIKSSNSGAYFSAAVSSEEVVECTGSTTRNNGLGANAVGTNRPKPDANRSPAEADVSRKSRNRTAGRPLPLRLGDLRVMPKVFSSRGGRNGRNGLRRRDRLVRHRVQQQPAAARIPGRRGGRRDGRCGSRASRSCGRTRRSRSRLPSRIGRLDQTERPIANRGFHPLLGPIDSGMEPSCIRSAIRTTIRSTGRTSAGRKREPGR